MKAYRAVLVRGPDSLDPAGRNARYRALLSCAERNRPQIIGTVLRRAVCVERGHLGLAHNGKDYVLSCCLLFFAYAILGRKALHPIFTAFVAGCVFGLAVDGRSYFIAMLLLFAFWLRSRRKLLAYFLMGLGTALSPNLYFLIVEPRAFLFDNLGYHAIRNGSSTDRRFCPEAFCPFADPRRCYTLLAPGSFDGLPAAIATSPEIPRSGTRPDLRFSTSDADLSSLFLCRDAVLDSERRLRGVRKDSGTRVDLLETQGGRFLRRASTGSHHFVVPAPTI